MKPIFRISFLVLTLLIFVLFLINAMIIQRNFQREKHSCKDCNVILISISISIDTLRGDELPCYGYSRDTAPNLCKFAKENVLFSNAFSQSSYTLDSHFSIFTSLYPSSHNVLFAFKDTLHPDVKTIAQTLRVKGYMTMFVGPGADQNLPLDKGIGRGFGLNRKNEGTDGWDAGTRFLMENNLKGKPTFLFLHTYWVHSPYLVDTNIERLYTQYDFPQISKTIEEYRKFTQELMNYVLEGFEGRIKTSVTKESFERNSEIYNKLKNAKSLSGAKSAFFSLPTNELDALFQDYYFKKIDKDDHAQVEYLRALYDENIYFLDQDLARLFDFLSQNNLSKNTILIITSDHGEEFAEHGELGHGEYLYNTSTRIPLIVSIPGVKAKRINSLVQSVDIFPTIFGLLGVAPPDQVQGIDLTDSILDFAFAKTNRYLMSEQAGGYIRSIRDNRWKLYVNKYGPEEKRELYDLAQDPLEQKNIEYQNQKVTRRLLRELEKILKNKTNYPQINTQFPQWIDETKRQKLKREGYF